MIFLKNKPCIFQSKLDKQISKQKQLDKSCGTSGNRNPNNLFIFQERELSYILGKEVFLYFRKKDFLIFCEDIFRNLGHLEL